MSDPRGVYFAIKRLEIHDGPGVRTTLFLKGCPLRCLWCHNPEGLCAPPQLAHYSHKCVSCGACVAVCPNGAQIIIDGKHYFVRENCKVCGKCEAVCAEKANKIFGEAISAAEILPELLLDRKFYEKTGGGVTVSGGEPLLQIDFLCELLSLLKKERIHTAVDTSLAVDKGNVERAARYADTFLCDIKAMNSDLHRKLTGMGNEQIISNILYLDSVGMPMEIRYPYVPGKNDGEAEKIAEFISGLKNVRAVKALAYHDLARTKYEALGMDYPMPETAVPSKEELAAVQSVLSCALR